MIKPKYLSRLIACTLLLSSASAFAIDQVTLTNGQVVQGKVLNDVPNRQVDLELLNGNTKRFERSEIASVDRDVPNRDKDRQMYGNQSGGFVSLLLGGSDLLNSGGNVTGSNIAFNYGIKAGLVSSQMGDTGRLGFALSYDRISQTTPTFLGTGSYTNSYNDLNFQVLLMRVANSGLYLGPNIGLAIGTTSSSFTGVGGNSNSSTNFEAGFGIGYDAYLSDSFSIGPEVRFEHVFDNLTAPNYFKFAIGITFHF